MQDNVAVKERHIDDKSKKDYIKRETNRKLKGFKEYTALRFSMGASAAIMLIFLVAGVDFKDGNHSMLGLGLAAVYLVSIIAQFVISNKVKKDILELDDISDGTRKIGYALIPFVLTANIFSAIGGLSLYS